MDNFHLETLVYDGINLNENHGPLLTVTGTVLIHFTLAVIALRLIARHYSRINFGLDDWLILFSAVFAEAYTALLLVEVYFNFLGQHIGHTDVDHVSTYRRGQFALFFIYPVSLSLSKLAILALYWRLYRPTKARTLLIVAAVLVLVWTLATVLAGLFACMPMESFWKMEEGKMPTCKTLDAFFIANEVWAVLAGLGALSIPGYYVRRNQQSMSQRASAMSTCLLGAMATSVSIFRLVRLVEAAKMPGFDPTFNDADAGLWGMMTLHLWVFVACFPAFRPLVIKAREVVAACRARGRTARVSSRASRESGIPLRPLYLARPGSFGGGDGDGLGYQYSIVGGDGFVAGGGSSPGIQTQGIHVERSFVVLRE